MNIEALSINDNDKNEQCDLLFLGGAPYANIMSSKLKAYAKELKPDNIKAVVLFSTSNWSKRTIRGLKRILSNNNIKVLDDYLWIHMLKVKKSDEIVANFVRSIIAKQ